MLAIEEGGRRGDIVVVTASGRLVAQDYRRFVPVFERLARSRGPLRSAAGAARAARLPGLGGGPLWEELKFDVTHQWAFRRIAVVEERRWQGWGTWLSRPLFRAEMRYFDRSRMEEARAWLGL